MTLPEVVNAKAVKNGLLLIIKMAQNFLLKGSATWSAYRILM